VRTIPHRELRNDSSKVLEEVRRGGVVEVTNHGQVVAILIPPGASRYDTLVRAGIVRPPLDLSTFESIPRVASSLPSADVLDHLRGE
jgi:prevent-host-death family protein